MLPRAKHDSMLMKAGCSMSLGFAALLQVVAAPTLLQAQFNYTTSEGKVTITRYTGTSPSVTVPARIDGLPVSAIGESAFYDCFTLTRAVVEEGITSIGAYSFVKCTNMAEITFPNSVTTIDRNAFTHCESLSSIHLPANLTTVEDYTFFNCKNLTNVVVPNSLARIGEAAFAFCGELVNVAFGDRIVSVGDRAFYICDKLEGVYFAGNAPTGGADIFVGAQLARVYRLPGTSGWQGTFGEARTELWITPAPVILGGSTGVDATGFGFTISWGMNRPVVVEACSDLSTAWVPIATQILTDGWSRFRDPDWVHSQARFFRVRGP